MPQHFQEMHQNKPGVLGTAKRVNSKQVQYVGSCIWEATDQQLCLKRFAVPT